MHTIKTQGKSLKKMQDLYREIDGNYFGRLVLQLSKNKNDKKLSLITFVAYYCYCNNNICTVDYKSDSTERELENSRKQLARPGISSIYADLVRQPLRSHHILLLQHTFLSLKV